jgi:hypothetical protein
MNRKQFGILLVLLIILGGAGLLLRKNQDQAATAGESGAGGKLLGDQFPINDVTHISIKQGANELNLVKKDEAWVVRERSDYPANFSQLSGFLIKAQDLKVVQVEQIGASQLPRLELAASGDGEGVLLDLKNKDDKSLKTLTLGKKHNRKPQEGSQQQFGEEGFADGRYVMVSGDAHNALLIADPLADMEPKPAHWVKKDFIKVEKPKAITVTFAEATNSWKLMRETEAGEWKLAEAKPDEKLDSSKASGVENPFSSVTIDDVVPQGAKPEDHGLDKPTVLTIDTFDGFTYTIKVGKRTGGDAPLTVAVSGDLPKERTAGKDEKPEDKAKLDVEFKDKQQKAGDKLKQEKAYEGWTFLVPSWTVDSILKERKDLLAEKKETAKADGVKN